MHRWSQLFIPTLREAPADAEVASHKFLVRAGYIRQLAAGLYSFLFLGNRTLVRITRIVREEMDRIGQEFYLPALHPREIWEASGRWQVMGDNMFRLKDRGGRDLCLGMTEEEVMTEIARKELRSYKQLPQIWYQIQQKFRDEPRPKSGLLRVRQFTMKDSYSFDLDAAGLDVSYRKHYDAYCRIFDRCGLKYVVVEAHSGAMGGSQSHEFMVYTDAGEDFVVSCPSCGYAANVEKATSNLHPVEELTATASSPVEVATPDQRTIDEVASYLGIQPSQMIKSYFAVASYKFANGVAHTPVVVFLRGDHSVQEAKVLTALAHSGFSGADLRPMQADEIRECFGLEPGFIGPVGLFAASFPVGGGDKWRRPQFYFDLGLKGRRNLVSGANKPGFHLRNVTPNASESFFVKDDWWIDLRTVIPGEMCPQCGHALIGGKAVEIGHIFKLGYKYSDSMGARVLDENGKEVTPIMGSYGIGLERILTSCIEQSNDENGFWLPVSIAPFHVVVVPTNTTDEKINSGAIDIANRLEAAGLDVLLDDRDERPGVKFKDADLVGIPYRVNVGKKLAEGIVEVVTRSKSGRDDVAVADVVEHLKKLLSRDVASGS
jgi:prolyl-tRNA synthetase